MPARKRFRHSSGYGKLNPARNGSYVLSHSSTVTTVMNSRQMAQYTRTILGRTKILSELSISLDFFNRILNKEGTKLCSASTINQPFAVAHFYAEKDWWGCPQMISHTEIFTSNSQYLVDGALILQADIHFVVNVKESSTQSKVVRLPWEPVIQKPEVLEQAMQRLSVLHSSGTGSDFVLVSKDKKEFPVHSAILIAHSPVFAAMFTHETDEKKAGRCEIPDVDTETLSVVLEFLYSCSTRDLKPIADRVLEAADKYDIPDLVKVCEIHLVKAITLHNVAHFLILADQHNFANLENVALEFVSKNMTEFVKQGGIQVVSEYKVDLMKKLLRHFANQEENGKQWR